MRSSASVSRRTTEPPPAAPPSALLGGGAEGLKPNFERPLDASPAAAAAPVVVHVAVVTRSVKTACERLARRHRRRRSSPPR